MIIPEFKATFIHIPKTAGVSFVHAVLATFGYNTSGEVRHLDQHIKERFELHSHQKHRLLSEYSPESIESNFVKFAFVRNPWDRLVSEYHWRIQHEPEKWPNTFSDFINVVGHPSRCNAPDVRLHLRPQWEFVSIDGVVSVNEIFKFEYLERSVDKLNKMFNASLCLRTHNASSHLPYQEYYNNESRTFVSELYHKDIELFGYTF